MADTSAIASIVGGALGAAVAVGVAAQKVIGWLTPAPERGTMVPPPPSSTPSLQGLEHAALSARVAVVEAEIRALRAEREEQVAETVRRAFTRELRHATATLRSEKEKGNGDRGSGA